MSLRPHLAATFWLGLPLVGAHVARNLLGVIDTVMVGRYGVEPLAALVLATSGFFILLMLGPQVFGALAARAGFDGFAVLEPHLTVAELSYGFTGPERFADAADALKRILDDRSIAFA